MSAIIHEKAEKMSEKSRKDALEIHSAFVLYEILRNPANVEYRNTSANPNNPYRNELPAVEIF
jgi:hypothetical protein